MRVFQTWALIQIEKVGKGGDSKIENLSKKRGQGREMEDYFFTSIKKALGLE